MYLVRSLPVLLLCLLTACASGPEMRDQFTTSDLSISQDQLLARCGDAPIIVAGLITDVTDIGPPRPSVGEPRVLTQQTKIKINIEVPIRGGLSAGPLTMTFFTFSMSNTRELGRVRYIPESGQRRIFFLKRSEFGYRSIGDVLVYSLPVRTGVRDKEFCRGKNAGCCIAEILLSANEGMDERRLGIELAAYSLPAAGVMCSPQNAYDLLRKLSMNSNRKVAEAAVEKLDLVKQWWPEVNTGEQ